MSSIIEGYNYDIFISYRQKDNKGDRWVSEFVEALKTELESTFKEEVSMYFDINPHDGLLETHDVDESLKEKLKCLIFIPIISRTYCDPKSFAWEHEFKAFVDLASKDQFSLKIKLPNGNVASRILPVKIHDLDPEDRELIENELGGILRGIEFIYKEPGVNKPLTVNDDEKRNLNNTKYSIQVNKTANAIKEIISGLSKQIISKDKETIENKKTSAEKEELFKENIEQVKEGLVKNGKKKAPKSIKKIIPLVSFIVLAIIIYLIISASRSMPFSEKDWIIITDFDNLVGDSIFDRSLNVALEVSVQQSSFVNVFPRDRIDETLKRMGKEGDIVINEDTGIEIAQREGIAVILTCQINRIGDTYLLTSKIIEVSTRKILRTETSRAKAENEVLVSLDKLAKEIRNDLGESLKEINLNIVPLPEATTHSLEALKYYAEGYEAWSREGLDDEAKSLLLKAIELDSAFAMANAMLGSIYYWTNDRINGEKHFTRALDLSNRLTEKEKLWIEARVEKFRGNYEEAIIKYNIFLRHYPSSSAAWFDIGHSNMMLERAEEAIAAFNKSLEINKETDPNAIINIASCYAILRDYQNSIKYYLKAFELNPKLLMISNLNHEFGFTYVETGEFQKAKEVFEKMIDGTDVEKARGYRSMALLSMYIGKYDDAIKQLNESIQLNRMLEFTTSELRDRLFLATAYKTKGMIPKFHEELNKVNLILSESIEPWWCFLYAKLLARNGKIQEADKILNEISQNIIKGNKSDEAAASILAGEIQLAKGNPILAFDLLQEGINLKHDCFTLESLANYYYVTRDLDMAIAKYKEIIDIDASLGWEGQEHWVRAHYYLGKIYERKAEYQQAVEYYKEFLNIWKDGDTDLPELVDAKERLLKLKEWEE